MNVRNWIEDASVREQEGILVVYEDERTLAVLHPEAAVIGHILIFSKEHYHNIADVPEEMISHFFYVASFAATAVFEGLKAQGTNILVHNGSDAGNTYDHFYIEVLPRSEDDGIDFAWEPKKDLDLDGIASKIKDASFVIGKDSGPSEQHEAHESAPPIDIGEDEEENYMIKQLRRIP